MSNLKMTSFGKLVLLLIVVGPIAYFGSKYLKESGILNMEDSSVTAPAPEKPSDNAEDILNDINKGDSDKEDIIKEQRRKIEELKRQNAELLKKANQKTTAPSDMEVAIPSGSENNSGSSETQGDSKSIDDLIAGAERSLGRKSTDAPTSSSTSSREALASWTFSFSNVSGDIVFFSEDGRLFAQTRYRDGRKDVSQLQRDGNRFDVQNSPTGEYYILKDDGRLDAYDRTGYLTTCSRK